MKFTCSRLLSAILAVLLCLTVVAFAEGDDALRPSDDLADMQVRIGNKIYTLVGSIEDVRAQGIRFESDDLKAGYYIPVNTGRAAFSIVLDAVNPDEATLDETYVCGYRLNAAEVPNAEIARGLVIGSATRKDVLDAFGAPRNDHGNSLSYRFYRDYLSAYFRFDGEADEAPLKSVDMTSSLPLSFGLEVSELAGKEAENLPDPTDLAFDQFIADGKYYDGKLTMADLLSNGWRLDSKVASKELIPKGKGSSTVIVTGPVTLFNGKTMLRANVYNAAEEGSCTIAESNIFSVAANVADGTSFVVADGITFGSTLEEVLATYGSNYKTEEKEDYIKYKFEMHNVRTDLNIIDNVVVYIEVRNGL